MTLPCIFRFNKVQRLWYLLPFLLIITLSHGVEAENRKKIINIGAIFSVTSRMGKQMKTALEIAVENFNNDSKTHEIVPYFRDSKGDPLLAASAAVELIKGKNVTVLIGMDTWQEAALVADVGSRAQVPVISFAAPTISLPLMQRRWPFLIRIASDAGAQMKCIADIVSAYFWRRVVVIYEDDGYGGDAGMLALLTRELQDVGSKIEHLLVLPQVSSMSNPSLSEIEEVLKLPNYQSRVFIVLQSSLPTVTNLFRVAKMMGLVGKDSAWILTESITTLLDHQINQDMKGTLGIKSYYPESTSYAMLQKVFQAKYADDSKPGTYALRAYDLMNIVTGAIRMTSNSATNIQVSLNTILSKYTGLSGKMHFREGEVMYSPIFRIVNIVEGNKYKELNFWRPKVGFTEDLAKNARRNNSVGSVTWPGNLTHHASKGWAMPTLEKPIIIGVPGRTSFSAFVKVDPNKTWDNKAYTGFCIALFHEVRGLLNYSLHYQFHAFNGSYDDLVELVYNKTFDAAVGDITVLADRFDKVEFTQPYTESGLSLIVEEKSEKQGWMFTKPLTWQMWVMTGALLVYTILIVWFLEHLSNPDFCGPLMNQIGTATWFTFTSLFFSQREKIHNNLTRVVVVVWLFVVLILSSSYTANLSSMLTVPRLQSNVTDIEMLLKTEAKVGCDGDSFVMKYLQNVSKFNIKNIVKVDNESNYPVEFKSKNISAAFLELPYEKVFMNEYCKGYTATTPSIRFGGLAFIFQRGSPITRDFTRAILHLLETGKVKKLEDVWLTPKGCSNRSTFDAPESLSLKSFSGIYVISGATSTICLLLSFIILLNKFQQHQSGNESDESVWIRTVGMAKFLYDRELPELTPPNPSATQEQHLQAQTEGSP